MFQPNKKYKVQDVLVLTEYTQHHNLPHSLTMQIFISVVSIYNYFSPLFCDNNILILSQFKGRRAFEVFWTYNYITQEPDVQWSNFAYEVLFHKS